MKVNLRSLALAVCLLTSAAVAGLSGCAGTQSKQSTGEYIDDKATNSRVKKALGEDVEYKFEHVNVDTFKGTVQLNGFVNTRGQKNKAADIANRDSSPSLGFMISVASGGICPATLAKTSRLVPHEERRLTS